MFRFVKFKCIGSQHFNLHSNWIHFQLKLDEWKVQWQQKALFMWKLCWGRFYKIFFYSAKKALEFTFDFISDSPKLVLLTAYFTFIISFFLITQLIQIIFTFVTAKWQTSFSPRHPPQSFSLQIVCCSKITRSVLCY